MSEEEVLRWSESMHYPQFVLARQTVIKAGKEAWLKFLKDCNQDQMQAVVARIDRWKKQYLHEEDSALGRGFSEVAPLRSPARGVVTRF